MTVKATTLTLRRTASRKRAAPASP